MESVNNRKRFIEIGVLVLLTIVLMVLFYGKRKYFSNLSNEGIQFIAKYAEGLKPINNQIEYTNEDVVNFALYGNLPLDRKNGKYLILNSDENGKLKYIITDAAPRAETDNYEKLTAKFDADKTKQKLLDTILSASKLNLYKSILFSANETYAISPKVHDIQTELKKEIVKLSEINVSALKVQEREFVRLSKKLENELEAGWDFIFVNPDTALKIDGKFKQLTKINGKTQKIAVAADDIDFSKINDKNFISKVEFNKGAGFVSINVPSFKIPKDIKFNVIEKNDNFRMQFENKDNEFNFNIDKLPAELKANLDKLNIDLGKQVGIVSVGFDSTGIFVKVPKADSIKKNLRNKKK